MGGKKKLQLTKFPVIFLVYFESVPGKEILPVGREWTQHILPSLSEK